MYFKSISDMLIDQARNESNFQRPSNILGMVDFIDTWLLKTHTIF